MTTAAILLSRQPLRPNGTTEWVLQVQRAVQWCQANNHLLLTSHGLQTWEMITAVGALHEIPIRIYTLPHKKGPIEREAWLRNQFGLEDVETEFTHIACDDHAESDSERDELIVSDADIFIPISIRNNGSMAGLLEVARLSGKIVIEDFRSPYEMRGEQLSYVISPEQLNPDLKQLSDHYLFHWTRTTNTAWPGERLVDYYRDIVKSEEYPRTAFQALSRIFNDRILIASPRHMPGNIPTVSFTGLTPIETAPLMRWRARYSEMSFEPYGIGIKRSAAEGLGIESVVYHDENESVRSESENYWLTQSIGTRTDWRKEKEYRHRGDLSLSQLSNHDLIIVCRTPEEARAIKDRFQLHVISFCR